MLKNIGGKHDTGTFILEQNQSSSWEQIQQAWEQWLKENVTEKHAEQPLLVCHHYSCLQI